MVQLHVHHLLIAFIWLQERDYSLLWRSTVPMFRMQCEISDVLLRDKLTCPPPIKVRGIFDKIS